MGTDQATEYTSSLMTSGCMSKIKGDNDNVILRSYKVNAKSYADDDILIVFEKLMKKGKKGNARTSGEKDVICSHLNHGLCVSFVRSASFYMFVVILF